MIVFTDQTCKPHVNAAASTNKSISVFTVRGEGVHSTIIPILPFSRKSRGPLLFLICVCEKGASGSDLKHTVTCFATEPPGLPVSVERMWTARTVGIWYTNLTSHPCCQRRVEGSKDSSFLMCFLVVLAGCCFFCHFTGRFSKCIVHFFEQKSRYPTNLPTLQKVTITRAV